jgi:hypothetical protein
MVEKDTHSRVGITSIICGLFGLIFYFIGWFFYSFVDNRLYGMIIGFFLGIAAIILGYSASKRDDNYGTYGFYLGLLILIIALLTILLTTIVTVETGYY